MNRLFNMLGAVGLALVHFWAAQERDELAKELDESEASRLSLQRLNHELLEDNARLTNFLSADETIVELLAANERLVHELAELRKRLAS
jgi:hypothetical protein